MRGWPLVCIGLAAVLYAVCLFPPVYVGLCDAVGSVKVVDAVQVADSTARAPSVYWWIALAGAVINTIIGFITANPPKDGKGGK